MNEKTINGMHKSELISLINDTVAKTNKIEKVLQGINSHLESAEAINDDINSARNKILNENDGFLGEIEHAHSQSLEKLNSIKEFHKEIFGDTETVGIQITINGLLDEFQEHNNNFIKLHNDIFGYTENNDGEGIEHIGELSKTKDIFKKYQEKYNMLFNQIEVLLPGATTTSLSKNFDDKVEEYKVERKKWETIIFVFLISLFVVSIAFAFIVVFNDSIDKNTIYTVGMPIYTFGIWFMIFMGNRRAESRKLEESFKHKFVMAKSFVGYKKSITEMTDTDGKLMNIHMNNLLNAISKDSSKFFEIKGESHPVADLFKKTKNSENRTNKTQE